MLTKKQVSWKNKENALVWCKLKGYRFTGMGAFDVYYVTPEQEGKQMQGLTGKIDAYSSCNWMLIFEELDKSNIEKKNNE